MKTENIRDIIRDKKNKKELSQEQIAKFVKGTTEDTIPECQITALIKEIYYNKMTFKETAILTTEMAKSGTILENLNFDNKPIVDKHGCGGLGEKTSFILSPIFVEIGLINPMISGRGLGHTGGTVDKLESFKGFNSELDMEEMKKALKQEGAFIIGQTAKFAPADKKIYALRDATETVDDISLITSSILSKKFAENIQTLVMMITCGTGAFMQTYEQAKELGISITETCKNNKINCKSIITRMDYPYGQMIGNACEIYEAIQIMTPGSEYISYLNDIQFDENSKFGIKFGSNYKGSLKENIVFIIFLFAFQGKIMADQKTSKLDAFKQIKEVWSSGRVLKKFFAMVQQQGGNIDEYKKRIDIILKNLNQEQQLEHIFIYRASSDCKIKKVDGVKLGNLMVELGAGRKVPGEQINLDVSMQFFAQPNQILKKGDIILKIYHPFPQENFKKVDCQKWLDQTFEFTNDLNFKDEIPLVYDII